MDIRELQQKILQIAKDKRWGATPDDIQFGDKIALLHAEVSEVLEAYRKSNMNGKDGVAEELADVIVRALHLAGVYSIDIEKELLKKLQLNTSRDWSGDQLQNHKMPR